MTYAPASQMGSGEGSGNMDLRSDNLYWPSTCRRPGLRATVPRKLKVDALIVGAGITGAFVAYELTKAGASVAIIDVRAAGSGSTPASTALLQYEIDTPLVKLSKLVGKVHASAAYKASCRALDDIAKLNHELGNSLELAKRRSLHLAVKLSDVGTFRAEVAARTKLGIAVEILSRRELQKQFCLNRPAAIVSADAFEVNPLKLTYRLLQAAEKQGAVILPRTKVDLSSLVERSRPFRLQIPSGTSIQASRIVIATGYETPEQFAEVAKLTELRSTFALATTKVRAAPWPEKALLWDSGDPYFYARTTADGRVLVGGEDEPFTTAAARDAQLASKSKILIKKLGKLVPQGRFRLGYCWAGTFAQTKDGLPYIGQYPKWPGVHFALGYGGNGITFSLIAAQIIAAAATGRVHPSARLFRFDR